jgi:hypothetical protein
LYLVDRSQYSLVQADRRHVLPFQDIADVSAARVEAAVDQQRDLEVTDGDFSPDWQPGWVGQRLALVRRVLVKHVDASADDLFRIEAWPHGRERRSVFPQQLARRPVDVGNDEIAINHHDGGRDIVYDVALESGHIVVSARNAS